MATRRGRKPTQKKTTVAAAGSYTSKKGVRGRRPAKKEDSDTVYEQAVPATEEAPKGSLAQQAVAGTKKAVSDYLTPDVAEAAKRFDYAKSQKNREESAAAKKRIDDTSANQRVSGRAKSRANELAAIHGRTDEEKIKSKAISERNTKVIRDAALAVAPGGAAGAVAAKVGYAKKAISAAKHGAKIASKLGAGSLKTGSKRAVGAAINKIKKAGAKKVTKALASKGAKLAKYKTKITIKGKANEAAHNV